MVADLRLSARRMGFLGSDPALAAHTLTCGGRGVDIPSPPFRAGAMRHLRLPTRRPFPQHMSRMRHVRIDMIRFALRYSASYAFIPLSSRASRPSRSTLFPLCDTLITPRPLRSLRIDVAFLKRWKYENLRARARGSLEDDYLRDLRGLRVQALLPPTKRPSAKLFALRDICVLFAMRLRLDRLERREDSVFDNAAIDDRLWIFDG